MKSANRIILAIAPGKREFGVAVFDGIELIYFTVRTLLNRHSERLLKTEVTGLIQNLITFSKPHTVVIKAVSQYQKTSTSLSLIVKIIKQQAVANQVPVVEVSLEQIKSALCDDKKPTLKKSFQNLTMMYPELRRYLGRPNKWQTEYYHNLFSAAAVGVVCFKSLFKR